MKKVECTAIIKRYELARKLVSDLNKKRLELIGDCDNQNNHDGFMPSVEICLVTAFKEWSDMCAMNDELYDYEEVLQEGLLDGRYCQNCLDSYHTKINDLAPAKAEFGKAKRALSFFGKKLLKGE